MFFVYHSSLQKVQEYKDLISLVEMFEKSDTEGDLFWTLGHKSWVPLTDILTGSLVAKKKYLFPSLPTVSKPETKQSTLARSELARQEGPEEVTQKIELKVVREQPEETTDFKIVQYEPPTSNKHTTTSQQKGLPKRGELRKHPRFDVRLKVIISNKEKTFLSYTTSASMGGILLEDNIPREFFASNEAEIFISSPKKNEFLAFRCRPVGDDENPKRFSFESIPEESLLKFQQWIQKQKN